MGPQETEPSAGRPEVLERRLGSVGREGVAMTWRLGPEGGSGAALEAAKADARAMSHRLGTRGFAEMSVGKVAKDWVEVVGTMGWGPAGARMDLAEVKAVLEKEGWLKKAKEAVMDRNAVAEELVKVAKVLVGAGGTLLDSVLTGGDVAMLEGVVDEQTYDLAVQVYSRLRKDFELSADQNEAIDRMKMSCGRHGMGADAHRNNIFKAAHALGIHLPSGMF